MSFPYILFTLAMLLVSCTTDLVSPGGSGTETTTGIVGVLVNEQGLLQPNAEVKLYPQSYNPVGGSYDIPVDTTDSLGRYAFSKLATGGYSLQAVHLTERTRVSIWKIRAVVDTVVVAATDTLRAPGAVTISLPSGIISALGYVYIPGTAIFTPVSGCADFVVLDSTPAGTVPEISWVSPNSLSVTTLSKDVQVLSEDMIIIRKAAWSHSRRCVLNTSSSGAGVFGRVSGFPVLIRLHAGNFDFTQARPDGADLRFERTRGIFLPYDIERWDPVSGHAEVWVKVDTMYGNDSTQSISMYWGNPDAADSSDGRAVFTPADGYVGVWHMNEVPSGEGALMRDRTGNEHGATPGAAMTPEQSVDGTIGRALRFDGRDDYLDAGDVLVPNTYSMGVWVLLDTLGDYQRFIYRDSSYTLWYDKDSVSVRMEHMNSPRRWRGLVQDGGTDVPVTTGVWNFFMATFDGSTIRLYENGSEVSVSNAIVFNPVPNSQSLVFGMGQGDSFLNGILDEVRIEGVARSPDWIRLCYMNQREDDRVVVWKMTE